MKDYFEKFMNWLRGTIEFLKLTRQELNNVSWPGRREVMGTTIVVIAAVFFFGFFLFLADSVVNFGVRHLFRALSAQ
jgi:preprotein translocase SecE subunit